MAKKQILNIVTTQCQPHEEEKFNKWYNETHVPMLLKFDRIQAVGRYKVINKNTELPQYLAVYKFSDLKAFEDFEKSPELEAAIKEMIDSWGKRIDTISRIQYVTIKEW